MLQKYRKGSNSGMPILAIVAVVCTLAGLAVIFQVVGSVGSQTGQDHDKRQLVDLGAAVENKCQDISGDTNSQSVIPISKDIELRANTELEKEEDQFILRTENQVIDTYSIPNESCEVNMDASPLSTGSYNVQISHNGENGEGLPKIQIEVN